MKTLITFIVTAIFTGCASFQPLTTSDAIDIAATSALILQKDQDKREALAINYIRAGNALIALSGTATREEVSATLSGILPKNNPEYALVLNLVLRFYQPGEATGAGTTAKQIGQALKRVGETVIPPLPANQLSLTRK